MLSFFTIAAICSVLSAQTSAAPNSLISLAIKNELNGNIGTASIPADGRLRKFPDLFAGTALDKNGQFFGTSAQLIQPVANTKCTIRSSIGAIRLNSSTPLIDLDGNRNVALLKPLVLNGFQVQCQVLS